jgi:hypothetical protein
MNIKPTTMKGVKQVLFIFITLNTGVILSSCHHKSTLKDMKWILGTWEGNSNGNTTYEKWSKLNDSTFHATAARSTNNVVSETQTMNLYSLRDTLIYEIAPGGNDSTLKPIIYTLTDDANVKVFSFSQTQRSFPSLIRYQHITDDSMTVTLSGKINKTFQSIIYPYKRAKDL